MAQATAASARPALRTLQGVVAGSAAHKTEMPAVAARQQFDDGAGFAMPPHAEHNAFVGPLHDETLQDSRTFLSRGGDPPASHRTTPAHRR